jgi:hypothetical protein
MADAHNNLGIALQEAGQLEEAVEHYDLALRQRPQFEAALFNRAQALRGLGRQNEAVPSYRACLKANPNHRDAHYNLANALKDLNRFTEAVDCYRQTLALDPDHGNAHWNLALACLTLGRMPEGWREYEWGLRTGKRAAGSPDSVPWDGSFLNGKTVLVQAEQGYGDTIQFVRYLPLVRERVGRVVLECQKGLGRLLQGCRGADRVVERPSQSQLDETPDAQVSLLSLPGLFGTTLNTVPAEVPYLRPEPGLREKWRQRLTGRRDLRVGLVWAGSPKHAGDASRSCSLRQFAPLARVNGVTFFSLQKGPAAEQAKAPPARMRIDDLAPDLGDFAETAAALAHLDLVISADTAVAHLAGAMARPVWTLVPFVPDWRWLLHRTDSPWYPSMRLFRQSVAGDWESVLVAVAESLSGWARRRADSNAREESFPAI